MPQLRLVGVLEHHEEFTMTIWAIVPAAGVGSRMATNNRQSAPKQYLPILGRAVISHSLGKLLAVPEIASVTVAIGAEDNYWQALPEAIDSRVTTVVGGQQRMESVLNALESLSADNDDWVLVHDAVRPCVRVADIQHLISELKDDPVGGLLASPADNTIKKVNADQRVIMTVDRDELCNALTPQMFRYGQLLTALKRARDEGLPVTDEASAIELAGLHPRIVMGDKFNIKITHEGDLTLAELLLRSEQENSPP